MLLEIKKVNVWSVVKVSFVVCAILGFVIGLLYGFIILSLGSLLSSLTNEEFGPLGGLYSGGVGAVFFIFFMPLLFAFIFSVFYGVIITGFLGWLYNVVAKFTGGARFNVDESKLVYTEPQPPIPPSFQTSPGGGVST